MTTYQDFTRQIGDQWVAALKRAEETATTASHNVQEAVAKIDLPQVPLPEKVAQFNESAAERLPKPREILKANFELTQRLLAAQNELALKLLAAVTGGVEAAPAAATKTAKKAPAKAATK